ncbi:hypothetical protein M2650_14650 [Luteimonas sp. SX5]|uniref:Lipoprotein n=1 Tax=Luteimonas galliterrae TaxID=2940486 RepID=A0ABT0MLU8_9GAMM|nr:hypothetical protein [Luteimonas galliterrae]MCL1635866.1 hypothetical protein [Luteimonas galliterrae]
MMRKAMWVLAAGFALAMAACGGGGQKNALMAAQNAYGSAMRWGEFESAWARVDPEYRDKHPLSELDLERYKQVQISSYRELDATVLADGSPARMIEIGVINKHTQAERTVRYREEWRWDAEKKTWWVRQGLPDLWTGG